MGQLAVLGIGVETCKQFAIGELGVKKASPRRETGRTIGAGVLADRLQRLTTGRSLC